MKYVILIHSNPRPWGHPTGDYLTEYQSQPAETKQRLDAAFEAVLAEMTERGELAGGEALGDPASARLLRWANDEHLVTDGPYAEGKEHLAGFFLVDVDSHDRAEQIARAFSGPGETVELRPVMGGT